MRLAFRMASVVALWLVLGTAFAQRVEHTFFGVEDHLHAFDIDEFWIVHDSAP